MKVALLPAPVTRLIVGFAITKGVALGVVVTAVIHASGLSTFAQGIIIALVSALIGALGMIVSALIAAKYANESQQRSKRIEEHITEVKDKLNGGTGDTASTGHESGE